MKKILFQGDSITDMGRSREAPYKMGSGYPTVVSAYLGSRFPQAYQFINKGIGGNRIVDVYARMKADIVNLQPDYMSLLIGVNDVWHGIPAPGNGVDAKKFGKIYKMLMEELQEELPSMKIMLMEPFILPGSATNENYDLFRFEVEKRADETRKIASEFHVPFIPLQSAFDEAFKNAEEGYWLIDGVHPTAAGHGLIAKHWITAFLN